MDQWKLIAAFISQINTRMHVQLRVSSGRLSCGAPDTEKHALEWNSGRYQLSASEKDEKTTQAFEAARILLEQFTKQNSMEATALEIIQENPDNTRLQALDRQFPDTQEKILFLIRASRDINDVFQQIRCFTENSGCCFLKGSDTAAVIIHCSDPQNYAENLLDLIASEAMVSVRIGYSSLFTHLSELKRCDTEAEEALAVVRMFPAESPISGYDRDLLKKMVYRMSPETREAYLNACRGAEELNQEDIHAVRMLMQCGMNAAETARRLYIHRNTLLYHMDRIRRLTGRDPQNTENLMELYLAILILECRSESAQKNS